MPTARTTLLIAACGGMLAGAAGAQSHAVTGHVGILGEWDLTATVTEQRASGGRGWAGPLSLRHVGLCSADGPEEQTGELRLQVSDPPTEATATLLIDQDVCTFSGTFKDGYAGVMSCPDGHRVPMLLFIE